MKAPLLFLGAISLAGIAGVFAGGGWRWIAIATGTDSSATSKSLEDKGGKNTSAAMTHSSPANAPSPGSAANSTKTQGELEARIVALEQAVAKLQKSAEMRGADPQRVTALEKSLKSLQSAMDGVSIEKASADRNAQFAGDDGYIKANEYFEAGKYAIAAEGFITFVQNHPNHPDTREVMKKARDSFLKAGYKDKAFWVQEEMMKTFPDHMAADVHELAVLEKNAGMYDLATQHMAQAAELAKTPEDRLWKRLYWAWYVQMRDGNPEGIAALQQVQREIAASGVKNPKLDEHAAARMREWQQQMQMQR